MPRLQTTNMAAFHLESSSKSAREGSPAEASRMKKGIGKKKLGPKGLPDCKTPVEWAPATPRWDYGVTFRGIK